MDSVAPGTWETDAGHTIDEWAEKTLLQQDWDGWIMYNDEPPADSGHKSSGSFGHTKGVVAWNAEKAGWLIHSCPLWPPAFRETFDKKELFDKIPDDQVEFGQSFAWIDVARADLPALMGHIAMNQPNVYAATNADDLWRPMARAPVQEEDRIGWYDFGDGVSHVAKCRQWGKCLFSEGLNKKFGGACIVETWCRPKPKPTADVWNAIVLGWPGSDPLVAYHESQDHSKYAVSATNQWTGAPWTYVGDINNMKSQWKRGGGGLVFTDPAVRDAFASLIHTNDRQT